MTTAYDLRNVTPTPHSERITIQINERVSPDDGSLDLIYGDLSLAVQHRTTLHRGLATTEIHSVQLYLSGVCLVPFELPADLEIRLINGIEAYFEQLTEQTAREDADERRVDAYLDRLDRYSAA